MIILCYTNLKKTKMTTLKGTIRSYGAAVRRIEREQQRQAREAAKRFKEQQKQQEIKNAKTSCPRLEKLC